MKERLLTIYGVLLCTLQAIVSTLMQYYAQWRLERELDRLVFSHHRQQRVIGKAILPVIRDMAEKVNKSIEKGA